LADLENSYGTYLSEGVNMEKDKNKQKANKDTQQTGSVIQYSNSAFF